MIAPALPEDEEYLRGLGVTDVVPRDGDVAAAVRERHPDGVDAVIDLVNYAPGTYDAALKDGGRVASPTNAAGEGPGRTNVMAAPTTENLSRVARHLADGTLDGPDPRHLRPRPGTGAGCTPSPPPTPRASSRSASPDAPVSQRRGGAEASAAHCWF